MRTSSSEHWAFLEIQPCNYQISKSIIHLIKFGDIVVINNLLYSDRNSNTDRQIICFKEAKLMDMILDKCIFHYRFLCFQ